MTEEKYNKYISDFNAACAGDSNAFGDFYDKYYEPDAIFEFSACANIIERRHK